jgi:hypothetical protein
MLSSSVERGLNVASGGTFPANLRRILNGYSATVNARSKSVRTDRAIRIERLRLIGEASGVCVLEHDPEKWKPGFPKDHAQTKR